MLNIPDTVTSAVLEVTRLNNHSGTDVTASDCGFVFIQTARSVGQNI